MAGDWHEQRQRETASGGVYRLSDAAVDWLAAWKGSERGRANAAANVKHWIVPSLGHLAVNQLQTEDIQAWLEDMASKPPVKIQQRNAKLPKSRQSKVAYNSNDEETKRKRRDTANRVFNDLAAICNRAFKMRKDVISDSAWRKVTKFESAREKQEFLTATEVKALLTKCDTDFLKLVYGSVTTGMRYMEQARLRKRDYSRTNDSGLITLIQPKTGKVKHVYLNATETQFFDELVKDKDPDDLVFTRLGLPWEKSNQQQRLKKALIDAGIKRHIRWHDLRHSAASLLAAGGTPLAMISKQLGHSSQRVTERYAHLVDNQVASTIRANKPVFSVPPANGGTNVESK
jgi:integrase